MANKLASINHEGGPPFRSCVADPLEYSRARRYKAAFGIDGSYSVPYFEPSGASLAWGIVSVGHANEEARLIQHSADFNPVLVAIVHKVQQEHFEEVCSLAITPLRMQAIRTVQEFLAWCLDAAGWSLLNCSTDGVGTTEIAAAVKSSIDLLERWESLPEWELLSLHRVLTDVGCLRPREMVA